jgi:streptogramin lyase
MGPTQVDADKRMWSGRQFVWIADGTGSSIHKINPDTAAEVNEIHVVNVNDVAELDGVLWATRARPDGQVPRDVLRISPVENTQLGPPVEVDPCCGGVTVGGGAVWVLSNTKLFRIDPKTLATTSIPVSGTEVAFGEGRVWALDSITGHYAGVDPATLRVVVSDPTPHDSPVAIAAGFGAVWIADAGAGVVTKVDLSGQRPNVDIRAGARPNDVTLGLGAVWVSSLGAGAVTRIDPVSETVADTYHVGGRPSHLVVWGRYVWVAMDRLAP